MAFLVATTTAGGKRIRVAFNDMTSVTKVKQGSWSRNDVTYQQMEEGFIKIFIKDHPTWAISFDGAGGTIPVTTINGNAPTSNDNLFTILDDAFNL